jgi:hypothetical protein
MKATSVAEPLIALLKKSEENRKIIDGAIKQALMAITHSTTT